MKTPTEQLLETEEQLKEIHNKKVALLDKYGIFGGGQAVNQQFHLLNKQEDNLESIKKQLEIQLNKA